MSSDDVTLCAILRDEKQYVIEWVAYHRLLGFEQIHLYSNCCTDGTDALLDKLQTAGLIKHTVWPNQEGKSPQLSAYDNAVALCSTEWILFIDADEFLVLHKNQSIGDFVRHFDADVSAIGFNWKIFGSGGKIASGAEPVIERFVSAASSDFLVNLHCKTISRTQRIMTPHIHAPTLKEGRFVDTHGNDVVIIRGGFLPSVRHDIAQINHYILKSKEEFEQKKLRGNANRPPESADKFTGRNGIYFDYHDRNDQDDVSILSMLIKTKKEMNFIENQIMNLTDMNNSANSRIIDAGRNVLSANDFSKKKATQESAMTPVSHTAILWWRQLFTELGHAACTGNQGPLAQLARDRTVAVLNLLSSIYNDAKCDVLYEIGAHNAETSKKFVASAPHRKAYAYEASRRVFERVSKGEVPARVDYRFCAVGKSDGVVTFYEPIDEKYSVWSSTLKRAGKVDTIDYDVDMKKLDSLAAGHELKARNAIAWIDVEGSGYDIILGGRHTIGNHIAALYIEVNDLCTYENSATSLNIIDTMLELGFVPVARDNQYHDAYNILFVHGEVYSRLRVQIASWHYKNTASAAVVSAALTGSQK